MKNAAAKDKQTDGDTLPDKFWKYYKLYENGEITVSECARLMDCSRTTIYKYIDMARRVNKMRRHSPL